MSYVLDTRLIPGKKSCTRACFIRTVDLDFAAKRNFLERLFRSNFCQQISVHHRLKAMNTGSLRIDFHAAAAGSGEGLSVYSTVECENGLPQDFVTGL